jgi:hypothetical protein
MFVPRICSDVSMNVTSSQDGGDARHYGCSLLLFVSCRLMVTIRKGMSGDPIPDKANF